LGGKLTTQLTCRPKVLGCCSDECFGRLIFDPKIRSQVNPKLKGGLHCFWKKLHFDDSSGRRSILSKSSSYHAKFLNCQTKRQGRSFDCPGQFMKVKILQLTLDFSWLEGHFCQFLLWASTKVIPPAHHRIPPPGIFPDDENDSPDRDQTKGPTRDSSASHNRPFLQSQHLPRQNSDHTIRQWQEEDEDALSFNFLYYIIQKFKIFRSYRRVIRI